MLSNRVKLNESDHDFLHHELPNSEPNEKELENIFNGITTLNLINLHTSISLESKNLITKLLIKNVAITSIIIHNTSLNMRHYPKTPFLLESNVVFEILVAMLKEGPRTLRLLDLKNLEDGDIPNPFQEFGTHRMLTDPFWNDIIPPVIPCEKIVYEFFSFSRTTTSALHFAFFEKKPVVLKSLAMVSKNFFYNEARMMYYIHRLGGMVYVFR